MKNHKINPRNMVDLVNLSTTAFSVWRDVIMKITNNPSERTEYMHFVSDVLDDLIKATYPLENMTTTSPADVTSTSKGSCGSKCNHKTKEPEVPKIIKDDFEGFLKEFGKAFDSAKLHTQIPERHIGEFRPKPGDIVTLKDGEKGNYMGNIEGTEEHRMWLENGLVRGFRTEDVLSILRSVKSK